MEARTEKSCASASTISVQRTVRDAERKIEVGDRPHVVLWWGERANHIVAVACEWARKEGYVVVVAAVIVEAAG